MYKPDHGLVATVSELSGRRLRTSEVVSAMGLSTSTYYAQREDGRLLSADNLIRLAGALDINPLELLIRYGLVTQSQFSGYALAHGWVSPDDDTAVGRAREDRYPLRSRHDAPPI